jgi:hypothetical protein
MSLFITHKHHIECFYTQLVALDADIKTWQLPDTYFRLGIKKLINAL